MATRETVIKLTRRAIEKSIQQLTLDIHADITRETPVDTGWARANWVPSINEPVMEAAGSQQDVGVATSVTDKGVAEVATWSLKDGPLYISNNVPYIGHLNNGSSTQAPTGFVEKAIQRQASRKGREIL